MKIRKGIVLFLAILLVFSNSLMISAAPLVKKDVQKPTIETKDKLGKADTENAYKNTDKVRVIVEVDEEPAIIYATKQGKKFSKLSVDKQLELQAKSKKAQKAVKNKIADKKVNIDYKENFTTVFNGFSGIMEYGDISKIEKLPGVAKVTISNEYQRPVEQPDMNYSKELIEAREAWNFGYKGEGMIVGIIDTGTDPSHQDFVLSNNEKAALTKEEVEKKIAKNGLPGKYHSEKVPYGYNYMDESQEILDLGPSASEHGMHVAGTVGANGNEENGGIKGVAPEAQLLALKVFGNDPEMGSTYGDIYIKAIDDAILLGADVLNMSLGSTASFVNESDPESQAITHAVENGILMSISAGNSAHLGNGFFNPYASNPDIGVVGSPGLSADSLQVASFENSYMDMEALTYSFGNKEGQAPYMSASSAHPNDDDIKTFELEFANLGAPKDFEGKDFHGKYALIQRGELAFTEKALNAQAAGAKGAIIYNNTDGFVSMATEESIVIPQLFMLKSDGDLLAEQLKNGEKVTITFGEEKVSIANPTAGTMSDFTSWGVTPNLDFKPEITAPGGNILSTLQNDRYGSMSGTSMAAPHVSGGAALVLERVDELYKLDGRARVEMAKNILMNTAKPQIDKSSAENLSQEIPYSPRRQGAGLMQLHAALTTPVVVTEKQSGIGKVALKEVGDKFSFTLIAENKTEEAAVYNLDANIQTDFALLGIMGDAYLTGQLDNLNAQSLVDAKVTFNDGKNKLNIPAKSTATIKVDVDLSEAKVYDEEGNGLVSPKEVFENGYFVEGFVTLTSEDDKYPELSVPYVGFNGDWGRAPVLDELAYDDNDSFYEQAGMLYECEGDYCYLGYDPVTDSRLSSKIAISPNNDGEKDHIIPLLSFLRNAKMVKYNILDKDGNVLRTIKNEHHVRKNYYDAGASSPYRLDPSIKWDGTVKGKVVPDGQYYFEIKTTIDYSGKEPQTLKVPVLVDTAAPEIDPFMLGTDLMFKGNDKTSGIAYYEVLVDGKSLGIVPGTEKKIELKDLNENSKIVVIATDYAGNSTKKTISPTEDNEKPVIKVETPDAFSIHNSKEVTVAGTVTDKSDIVEFQIEGKDVVLTWDSSKNNYQFSTKVKYKEDGAHPIRISATDAAGNQTSLSNSRIIFVDTTAPEMDIEAPSYVDANTESVEIITHLKDNAEELRLLVDGSEVFYNEMPGYEMKPFSKEVTTKVTLKPGENSFKIEAIDLAKNKTTKEIKIYRAKEGEARVNRLEGKDRLDTAVEVSKKGWEKSDVVILARWDDYADALTGVPLAKKHDAPLLLTQTNKLSQATKAEIERLGTKTVYLLGGEVAISVDVETQLKELGIKVKRLAGANRADTAVKIAKEVVNNGKAKEVVLVNGYNFPDALSVASYAAEKGLPILVTQDKKLSTETKQALKDFHTTNTLVIGGEVAVDSTVTKAVPNAFRIAGKDRFATAVEVAKYFDVDTTHYYVTTGMEFADALSSAALAAKEGTGVLLVWDKLPEQVSKYISDNKLNTLTIVGGPKAISEEIQRLLNSLLK